jgi:hypothetical protein
LAWPAPIDLALRTGSGRARAIAAIAYMQIAIPSFAGDVPPDSLQHCVNAYESDAGNYAHVMGRTGAQLPADRLDLSQLLGRMD